MANSQQVTVVYNLPHPFKENITSQLIGPLPLCFCLTDRLQMQTREAKKKSLTFTHDCHWFRSSASHDPQRLMTGSSCATFQAHFFFAYALHTADLHNLTMRNDPLALTAWLWSHWVNSRSVWSETKLKMSSGSGFSRTFAQCEEVTWQWGDVKC